MTTNQALKCRDGLGENKLEPVELSFQHCHYLALLQLLSYSAKISEPEQLSRRKSLPGQKSWLCFGMLEGVSDIGKNRTSPVHGVIVYTFYITDGGDVMVWRTLGPLNVSASLNVSDWEYPSILFFLFLFFKWGFYSGECTIVPVCVQENESKFGLSTVSGPICATLA